MQLLPVDGFKHPRDATRQAVDLYVSGPNDSVRADPGGSSGDRRVSHGIACRVFNAVPGWNQIKVVRPVLRGKDSRVIRVA